VSSVVKIDFEVPDREKGEYNSSEGQVDLIERLCDEMGIPDGALDYRGLGIKQASSLIEQMLIVKRAGGKVTSTETTESSISTIFRSLLLVVGVVCMPYIFSWFTLQSKYSKSARVFAFGWLIFIMFILWLSAPS